MKRVAFISGVLVCAAITIAALTGGAPAKRSVAYVSTGMIGDNFRLHPRLRPTPSHPRHRVVASRAARRTVPRVVVQPRATSTPKPAPTHASTVSGAAGQLASWVNDARARGGLRSAAWNGTLGSYARSHSSSMAASGSLYHTSPSTLLSNASHSCSCSTAGEIVGKGTSIRQVFDLFMADSAHRSVIMNSSFRYQGVGVVYSHGWYWVTIQFAG